MKVKITLRESYDTEYEVEVESLDEAHELTPEEVRDRGEEVGDLGGDTEVINVSLA